MKTTTPKDAGSIRTLAADVRKAVSALMHKVEESDKTESRRKSDAVYDSWAYKRLRSKYQKCYSSAIRLQSDNTTMFAALQELGKEETFKLAAPRMLLLKNFEKDRDSWRNKCRELKCSLDEQTKRVEWFKQALAERDAKINKMNAEKVPWPVHPHWNLADNKTT